MNQPTDTHFAYDPNDRFTTYPSAAQAEAACKAAFASYQAEASNEGWSEDVDQLCWGAILHRAGLTKSIDRPPVDVLDGDGFDAEGNHWGEWDALEFRALLPVAGTEPGGAQP